MKAMGIVLVIVGLIFAGLTAMYYSQYRMEAENALRDRNEQLAKAHTTAESNTPEASQARRDYISMMGPADHKKGYSLMNAGISVTSIVIALVLFVLARKRRLASA